MKPLKILLGNNTLSLLAGSETWTLTLARELKRLGHTVHCFSPNLGVISDMLITDGIPCFSQFTESKVKPFSYVLEEKLDQEYDVIIANHCDVVRALRAQYPKKPIISTIHGIIHQDQDGREAPEHPAMDAGVNQFVAVSEEVRDLLQSEYNIDSLIIRNFIDTKHFASKKKPGKKISQILFNSNYNSAHDKEVEILREVAKHYGAHLAAIGQNFAQSIDTKAAIEKSDVVVGMGRSVLEGLAMGKLGIVFGRWGYGGLVKPGNIERIRSTNFSGRGIKDYEGVDLVKEIIAEIDGCRGDGKWERNYILRDHNATTVAEMYVTIARELLGQPIKPADDRRPYRRQRDVQPTS